MEQYKNRGTKSGGIEDRITPTLSNDSNMYLSAPEGSLSVVPSQPLTRLDVWNIDRKLTTPNIFTHHYSVMSQYLDLLIATCAYKPHDYPNRQLVSFRQMFRCAIYYTLVVPWWRFGHLAVVPANRYMTHRQHGSTLVLVVGISRNSRHPTARYFS